MVGGSMSSLIENVSLPGLGSPEPEPVARATDPDGALREVFGFESFRPGQREAHCDACFSGSYPLGDDGGGNGKFALEVVSGAAARA